MPYADMKDRKHSKEWAARTAKQGELVKHAERAKARRIMDAEGVSRKGKDVDHKVPLSRGGTNARSNLRVISPADNRSFKRAGPGGKPKK